MFASLTQNPILKREFVVGIRKPLTAFLAGLTILTLSAILYILWPRTGVFSDSNSNELFTIFLGTELTFMILMTAGFTASAITAERERNSFVMLQTSLLTPGEILLGKLFGTLGVSVVLFLVSVPVMALCALSGGISLWTLGKAVTIVGLSTIVYGLLGLAMSSICRRSYISLLGTYLGIVILAGATWLPSVMLPMSPLHNYFVKLRALSPYEALFALQFAENYESSVVGASSGGAFQFFFWSMLILGVIFFFLFAHYLFAPPRFGKHTTVTQYTDTKTMIKRKLGWPFYLIDPLRRKKPIPMHRNPVFVAEMRSKIFGNPKFIIRALTGCICLSLVMLFLITLKIGTVDMDSIRAGAIIFQLALVALLAPTVSSGSITDETTSNTLLLLRLTPLSPAKVILGKFKAALLYVLIFLLSSLPVFLALIFFEDIMAPSFLSCLPHGLGGEDFAAAWANLVQFGQAYWRIFAWLGVLVTTCLMLISGGLCASSFAPNTGVATAISYGYALLMTAGSLVVLLFGNRVNETVKAVCLMFNPFVAALEITLENSGFQRLDYRIWGHELWYNHLLLFSGLTIILLVLAAIRVNYLFKEQK
ncbi:MAG: hypothetical protein IKS83_09325 [Victivallales bacterium]|nr:hypothetical protein [Victivallales bacterium]